jgi:ATP-dependent DNA helicase
VSRLLLTGTPIQNTLEELWSLLNFCSPAIFDSLDVFQSWFGFKNIGQDTQVNEIVSSETQDRVVTKLHEILRPFLLRRLKKDVLLDMPPKVEIVLYCGMSTLQSEYNKHIQARTLRETLTKMNIEGANNLQLMNPVMQYRKAANHPFLFGEPKDESGQYLGEVNPGFLIMASGKLRVLDRLLNKLHQQGNRVLIFSQMTEMMSILEDYLNYKSWHYCRLDGSTKIEDRQEQIDAFNYKKDVATHNNNLFVFLLSTRAGGLGINLTAADTCILFDSDWNPHADSQAMDRCHRIGQKKPVVVYRMLTSKSVEIDMMEKQISKKKLERLTVIGGDFRKAGARGDGTELTLSKLRQLLEDDVKNLSRVSSNSNNNSNNDYNNNCNKNGPQVDISDAELDVITDRSLLFEAKEKGKGGMGRPGNLQVSTDPALVREGFMYDIIESSASSALGGINN